MILELNSDEVRSFIIKEDGCGPRTLFCRIRWLGRKPVSFIGGKNFAGHVLEINAAFGDSCLIFWIKRRMKDTRLRPLIGRCVPFPRLPERSSGSAKENANDPRGSLHRMPAASEQPADNPHRAQRGYLCASDRSDDGFIGLFDRRLSRLEKRQGTTDLSFAVQFHDLDGFSPLGLEMNE